MLASFIALFAFTLPSFISTSATPCLFCFLERYIFLFLFLSTFFRYYLDALKIVTYFISGIGMLVSLTHLAIILNILEMPRFCKTSKFFYFSVSSCVNVSQKTILAVFISVFVYLSINFFTYKDI